MVTRYEDAVHVLRNTETFSSALGMSATIGSHSAPATGVGYRMGVSGVRVIIATDPPEHQVIRRAIRPAFTRQSLVALESMMHELADELVRGLVERGAEADFYRDVAEPMPVVVLASMFGVPASMHEEFRRWVSVVTAELDQGFDGHGVGRGLDMLRYFRRELAKRRTAPSGDLLSVIAAASDVGLSDHELLAQCVFLLVAGVETTTNLLTNLIAALSEHPEAQDSLRRHPHLLSSAVEEALRYDSPVQALWRSTTRPTELGGESLPANARVLVAFGAANRDPARFPDPDRFLVNRSPNDHIAFGSGPHLCIGSRLARMEVKVVLKALLDRTSWISLRGAGTRTRSPIVRGFVSEPVVLG
ncbi:cytochrome P450 [Blastococcus sp. CCUG 61487]|uniref:cytochrome P450 n=1 Tax=Blastococcus sp. CCUG 61487 TaxID=1840703 RepID=UPI00148537F6|nr:cytochrome P450 [Blastococcus sp. CCUG 61487]